MGITPATGSRSFLRRFGDAQLLAEIRPARIIAVGTRKGGSALSLAQRPLFVPLLTLMSPLSLKVRWLLVLAAAGLILMAVGHVVYGSDLIAALIKAKVGIIGWSRESPYLLFAALVILPGFAFPVSPLLILAGATWGSNWSSCGVALLAMFLNMSWTYFLAAGPAHKLVARLLGTRWDRWRKMERGDRIRLAVLLRVTPGIPLFVQNYVLGLLAVPYPAYILISLPINAIFVVGFVLTGGAIFEGHLGLALTGVGVLAVAILLVHLLRARLGASAPHRGPEP